MGETGPYVQYAALRARKVLAKAGEVDFRQLSGEAIGRQLAHDDTWQLVLAASKMESAVAKAVSSGEPAHVARYAFQLAQEFSGFYDKHHIVDEPNPETRVCWLWATDYFRSQLERTLGVLGIEVPEYM